MVWDTWVQREMEQMLIKQHVLKQQRIVTSRPPELRGFDKNIRQKLVQIELPNYILDMGSVTRGATETHTVDITNTGPFPVSFQIETRVLQDTGNQCWRDFPWA
ncbi:hydrocephalus-inducing protein homolog [Manacus vitellinus]|uniref:hydrocephalus-inducing protein homolog n=1 Tax=Manacus vitellinus TaxID=328815 RepID=UPI0008467553|nr:hydrocephalus-inducing protein homolog [Manacus vitellinus]